MPADKVGLEMDTLGNPSTKIHKRVDYDVQIAEVHLGDRVVVNY